MNIFNQFNINIEKSIYNIQTQKIIYDYYPNALVGFKLIKQNQKYPKLMHLDISKSYPNCLINNSYQIPIYNIHNTIEPFNNISELNQTGEFYIDVIYDRFI